MIGLIPVLVLVLAGPMPPAGLQPLAFLVGHCWQGQLPTPGQVDRHCFTTTADGAIRDRHVVSDQGRRLLAGESLYRWDAGQGAIAVAYRDSTGGRASGVVRVRGSVVGVDMRYVAQQGRRIAVLARWTRIGETAWRADLRSPDMPGLDGTVLYRRTD